MSLILFLAAVLDAPSLPPKEAFEVAIAELEHQEKFILAWDLKYSARNKSSAHLTGQPIDQETQYHELRGGSKFRTILQVSTDGKGPKTTSNGFDGAIFRQHSLEGKSGTKQSGRGVDYSFREYVYGPALQLADPPGSLSEGLRAKGADSKCIWTQLSNSWVLECDFEYPDGSRITLDLDPVEHWQPRRMVSDVAIAAGTYPDGRTRELLVLTTEAFLKTGGIVLPSRVRGTYDAVYGSKSSVRLNDANFVLHSCSVNPSIPESDFVISFPPGTRVTDVDRQIVYVEGQPDSERSLGSRSDHALADDGRTSGIATNRWADARLWLLISVAAAIGCGGLLWRAKTK